MKLDHIAFRVRDRHKAKDTLSEILGYLVQQQFPIDFGNGQTAECISLYPDPRTTPNGPEFFLSDGSPGSIVGEWVEEHNLFGGIHHIAFSVDSVERVMNEWKGKGIEFSSDPIHCPEDDLIQVFTKPLPQLGGIVFELIQRGKYGFCKSSVKQLMESSVQPSEEQGELT